ncbi:T9SS type A sorting domain-containing protein, partial [Marinirhabdus gelatinilytica]|uniref:T9SS type A sorting domain-containing protein n=1 Tax=Marinirhabdus gelatinilytica TaxID=1703343 RepID=UPI0011C044DC
TLVCVAENDDSCGLQSEVSFQGDGSSTYYILVNGFGSGSSGDFSLNLECAPVPPPNDMIVNSIDVDEIGFPYTDPAVAMPAATTEAGGTPANCDNAGVLGVWYNFVPTMGGTATASVTSPAGFTSVTFYTAPDENAVETDLTLVDWFDNQCVPGVDASIPVTAGQAYYVYVANHEGITDIVIDGDFFLGVGDAVVDGFTYYPNPANDEITLDAGTRSIETATIYNILGQTVVEQTVGAPSTQLNVANLTVGTYILKVLVDGETGIYKIVKQ